MKKKTKIIIISVVAVALVALAVWYFGFHQNKSKETDDEGENRTPVNPTETEDIVRTDYGVAPAAAYRLNHDQLTKLDAQLGRPSNAIVNTNKINR